MALGAAFAFDGKNDRAREMVDRYTRRYRWRIARETRDAISAIVRRSILEGIPPLDAARLIKSTIGLNRQQAEAVASYRTGLLEAGLDPERVAARVNQYAAKKLLERAETIARTEVMGALNAGSLSAWRQAQDRGLLSRTATKEWITTYDERTCDVCAPMDGEAVPLDKPFSVGVDMPPAHPRCRCTAGAGEAKATRGQLTAQETMMWKGRPIDEQVTRLNDQAATRAQRANKMTEEGLRNIGFDIITERQEAMASIDRLAASNVRVNLPSKSLLQRAGVDAVNRAETILTTLREMEAAVEAMAGNMGRGEIVLGFYSGATNEYAHAMGSKLIEVNLANGSWRSAERMLASALRDTQSFPGMARFHPGSGKPGEILIHETGHVLQMRTAEGRLVRDAFEAELKNGKYTWTWREKQTGAFVRDPYPMSYDALGKPVYGEPKLKSIYSWTADPESIAREVSRYAAVNPAEFVAETYQGLISGEKYSERVMRLYEDLHGPKVNASRLVRTSAREAAVIPKPPVYAPPLKPVISVPKPPAPPPNMNPLLPKGAKPVGDPIPAGAAGELVQKVIELRRGGMGYAAIERTVGRPPQNGTWAFNLLKKYGGGRL